MALLGAMVIQTESHKEDTLKKIFHLELSHGGPVFFAAFKKNLTFIHLHKLDVIVLPH